MCGIAGIYNYAEPDRPVDGDLVVRMTRVLAHRGPDDEGFYISGPVGLGHRRLSIVDLSATGHQPMANGDETCWITYNGELYNHSKFRKQLTDKGCRFRGSSDTETLLHLIEEEGPDALSNAAGIFAFAFWDARKACLTLVRDPLGVKQLYYHDDGRRIVFASEIKALLQCDDVPRHPDPEAVNQYLHFHTSIFEKTFFHDIHQVRAGEYIQITRYGRRSRIYWEVNDFTPLEQPIERLVESLRAELSSTVGEQLMSDVPVGAFFSGGIDSSSIAAYASRNGKRPTCFGVHFSNQGVADERPYQEAAAKALGLDLHLITLDGSSFADDLMRLLYHQDQPVIGAAMFPMAYVSQLAAQQVKVCLGGQGADELFGGYARYALARPGTVIASWFRGRASVDGGSNVSGNLGKQLGEKATLKRLARNARRVLDWESGYFENFAKVPESTWAEVFAAPQFHGRARCRQMFHEYLAASPAVDPADKIMHWDMRTYLTGLFHQDDRMSMAASLESRVPIADPRLVKFAFRIKFDAKFRGGASKWILRQAVADVLPQSVITRRKVGFDTPAQAWMKGPHFEFVRDLLLSKQARERGLWNIKALEARISQKDTEDWFDVLWKVMSIEAWATLFLDRQPRHSTEREESYSIRRLDDPVASTSSETVTTKIELRDGIQEIRELGTRRTIARTVWEVKTRSGLLKRKDNYLKGQRGSDDESLVRLPAPQVDPLSVSAAMRNRIPKQDLVRLLFQASEATRGRILSFSRQAASFGEPIDWHLNPHNGRHWRFDLHWTEVLRDESRVGDVKLTWEAARFPQAFHFARAAAFNPDTAVDLSRSLFSQIDGFLESSVPGHGVHWNSSQEIVLRLIAWSFALATFERHNIVPDTRLTRKIEQYLQNCAIHLGNHIEYARDSVYNNHLISEALGLYFFGDAHPSRERAVHLQQQGLRLLDGQANLQFYPDGSYIMHSHNYHRAVMQLYLWAIASNRSRSLESPASWYKALERSLDFLIAHQNPSDGTLPNFGANDGSIPLPLSICEFADFRPTLQAASIATRQERIYEPGPWDEMAAWLFGADSLNSPKRTVERKSVSFSHGGYQVLRGSSEGTFASFRCGSLLDRFSQIDMLHLDVFWRGHNVLVDGGSYLYNGPQQWHEHFCRTGSHNTVQVDDRDQMVQLRRFKNVYRIEARLLKFEDTDEWSFCEGEHYGFLRKPQNCVHRRSVLFVKDDMWIVVDRVTGSGTHKVRLQWLAGEFPYHFDKDSGSLELTTPDGLFSVSTRGADGLPLASNVACGRTEKPRGWLSRHYGHKVAVPSFVVEQMTEMPITLISILGAGKPEVKVEGSEWHISAESSWAEFSLIDGSISVRSVHSPTPLCCP